MLSEVEVAGMLNDVTSGAMESGIVIVIVIDLLCPPTRGRGRASSGEGVESG